jgi:hypothetical protein
MSAPTHASSDPSSRAIRSKAVAARRLRGDMRFLRVYVLATNRILRYKPHPASLSAPDDARSVVDRIETGLAEEAHRYRLIGWSIAVLIVGPLLLSGLLWSGMYWLPVTIYWWPFERGNYGLPYLSLFEWLAYLLVAAYFVVAWILFSASHAATRKLATEYKRLADAPASTRPALAEILSDGVHPRAAFVARHSAAFSAYIELMDKSEHP